FPVRAPRGKVVRTPGRDDSRRRGLSAHGAARWTWHVECTRCHGVKSLRAGCRVPMAAKQLLFSATLTVGSLLASLTAVEYAGRAAGAWHPSRMFRYSATRGYELTPNVGDVNALGFRGSFHDARDHRGVVRIIVLGDSFTYGDGVTAEAALPAQL